MQWQTLVDIPDPGWRIEPTDRLIFVGSCFAENIGSFFIADHFQALVNPYGVMYNPVSVLHTLLGEPYEAVKESSEDLTCDVAVLTLGTNHVYEEIATNKIVDNCKKRPQREFCERQLTVDECAAALSEGIGTLQRRNPSVRVVLTVSPIRYRKYGYHESQLSKAVLLLAVDKVVKTYQSARVCYFPSYELVLDELRDYRFYADDMLHPSAQAVSYIYDRFSETFFSDRSVAMAREWRPIREALQHRPFHPESEAYQKFLQETHRRKSEFEKRYFPTGFGLK